MFLPLYPGASISVCAAYCAIMCLQSRCHLPFTTIGQILKLLQLLCPENNKLPKSVFCLRRFFSKFQSHRRQSEYCPNCNNRLESSSCSHCLNRISEPDVFIQLDLQKQLQAILNRKFL